MILKFDSKTNQFGWRYQLEVDTDKKLFRYGSHMFYSADVEQLTKKQLEKIVSVLLANGYDRS